MARNNSNNRGNSNRGGNSRGGNSRSRNNNPEGKNQYSSDWGVLDLARERPLTATAVAAGAAAVGLFAWSRRAQTVSLTVPNTTRSSAWKTLFLPRWRRNTKFN